MKLNFTIAFCTLLWAGMVSAQCYNGISTNPANPLNSQLSSKTNTFFNWQDSVWQVQPISSDCIRGSSVESPFYKIDNLEGLRAAKDMQWSDGWELIRRGFGLNESNNYTADPVPNLYLIMYNKYTGILRILLKVCRGADYNSAKITLQFDATSQMKTDLLEISKGSISALDKVFVQSVFGAGATFYNDNTKWFYADFPMMYDPCTCSYKSKLNIISQLISTSQISLEGKVTGDIYTQNTSGKAQIQQQDGSYTWKDFSSTVNGKVATTYTTIDNFRSKTQAFAQNLAALDTNGKGSAISQFATALKDNQFLKAGLSAIPWLESAVSLLDIFIGGGKKTTGPTEVKLLPLSVDLTAKLSGSITTANSYHNIIFTNPGSKDAALDPDIYPYYNEVLGVFNLLQTPEIWHEKDHQLINEIYPWFPSEWVTVSHFRLDTSTIKYVLNPAAEMTIQDMQFSIVTKGNYNHSYYEGADAYQIPNMPPDFRYIGKDALNNSYKFETLPLPGKCMAYRTFKALSTYSLYEPDYNWGMWGSWAADSISADTSVYLKVYLNLQRNNTTSTTQNILYVLTYPAKLKPQGMMRYGRNDSCDDNSLLTPASSTDISSFCSSSTYVNYNTRFRRATNDSITGEKESPQIGKDNFYTYPNPANKDFMVYLKQNGAKLKSIQVIDVSGRTIYNRNEGNVDLQSGFTKKMSLNLQNGVYMIIANTNKRMLKSKIVISRQ